MEKNIDLKNKINKIKNLQKKYIRSGYDSSIKSELDKLNEELFNIPIYKIYLDNLEVVNQKLDYVKDSLNDYFYKLFNASKRSISTSFLVLLSCFLLYHL